MPCGRWWQPVNKAAVAAIFVTVAAIAGAAGFYLNRTGQPTAPAAGGVEVLMRSSLADLRGNSQQIEQWQGRVLVVNFWATWCAPCREEIPALMRVQKKHDSKRVKIVGIAIDNADEVRDYASKMKIDYTLLIGSIDTMEMVKEAGNRAGVLPFTLVLDRTGKVVHTHTGMLTEAALDALLAPLL